MKKEHPAQQYEKVQCWLGLPFEFEVLVDETITEEDRKEMHTINCPAPGGVWTFVEDLHLYH